MKTKSLALAACLLLTFATLANGFQLPPEWVKYTSVEGRYSVLLPKEPKLDSQEATAATGEKFTQYMAQTNDSDSFYWLGYFDYTPSMTFSLDDARNGAIENVKGALVSEEAISLGGYPGRELKVSAKNAGVDILMRVRFYDVGRRVYILQHIFQKSTDSPAIAQKTAKFFDSFKVTAGK